MEVKQLIDKYEGQMIKDLQDLISINSVLAEPKEDAPFGEGPKQALLTALKQCEALGFETKNVDNYAGHAEIGSGEQLIAVVAHLDVVPGRKERKRARCRAATAGPSEMASSEWICSELI